MDIYTIQLENFLTIILFIIGIIIVGYAQIKINVTYKKYKKQANTKKISGSEVARTILDANGLNDIYVVETTGELTDHYDPTRKVIKLSTDIFHGETIAAMAVAAHECGHAIQDKENYTFMRIRHMLVPIVNLVSYMGYFSIFVGFLAGLTGYLLIGIITLCATTLFQLVTLPVEFDASKRANEQILKQNLETNNDGIKSMLSAAAFTYVASLISSILNLLRLIIMFNKRDE